jgi:hypothetical protein
VSAADPHIEIDERLRAVLLWDEPRLWSANAGAQQWLRVLRLELAQPGQLDVDDAVSLSAHLVRAAMLNDTTSSASLRSTLSERGDGGQLLAGLVALWLELDTPEDALETLNEVNGLIGQIAEGELRARLLLRLASFALQRGQREQARGALTTAVALTDTSTRLGVVSRRRLAGQGVELPGFNPWGRTDTPDDPLLTLPWVRVLALDAAAALAAGQLEHELRGVWDTSFHVGRTKLDDLLAAHAQAEWCGALDLRALIRQLASSHMLLDRTLSPQRTRWALVAWATSESPKRVPTVIRTAEDKLDAAEAGELLREVRNEGLADWRLYVEVAAGAWDLLDDAAATSLLRTLVNSLPDSDVPQVGDLIGNLLWRSPKAWAHAFTEADEAVRTAMLDPLTPYHVDVMPATLRAAVIEHRGESDSQNALDIALAFATHTRLESWPALSPHDALELLRWQPDSLPGSEVEAIVNVVLTGARSALQKARDGSWSMGDAGTRALGELAAHLDKPRSDVVDVLLSMCDYEKAAARWQFGALEGLMALRRVGHLSERDIDRIRQLDLSPGRAMLGDEISTSLLRAAMLRVCAPALDEHDVTWLATCARGTNAQSRLVAIAALSELGNVAPPAVEWSLVSALFDPSDEVVSYAVGAFARAIGASQEATAVARSRLKELYESAGHLVRQQVVLTATKRPDLDLGEIIAAARNDRAWSVRRETCD